MDAATVGGFFISAFLQVLFDRIAPREIWDLFRARKLDGPLRKLKITLIAVNNLIQDAEDKQFDYPLVGEWLQTLQGAVYDAEDLLDAVNTEAMQLRLEEESSSQSKNSKPRRFFFSSNTQADREMEAKLNEILEELEYLKNQKDELGLKEGVAQKPSQRGETTSLIGETILYGRDSDKKAIEKLLLSDSMTSDNNLDVITIKGMGGLGKTTLAQLVYNDDRVKEHFGVRAWVCISEETDVFKVTRSILEAVGSSNVSSINSLDGIQVKLQKELSEKKFLLVLDDVWNEDPYRWEMLKKPLLHGAKGSKILVTTRIEVVAEIMEAVSTYDLQKLSKDDSWLLFAKQAFKDGDSPALREIGRKIVEKCGGLPLALKVLGGLLRYKRTSEEWVKVLESNMWELKGAKSNILPVLRVSYHYLPSRLKQCFAYSSIYPKDHEFEKEELIRLWMAQGFLLHPEGRKTMEELGDEYFNELVSRSFFQHPTAKRTYCFVMHDLIHDLANFVSRQLCFCMQRGSTSQEVPTTTRHLSYSRRRLNQFAGIPEANCLRTFLQVDSSIPFFPYLYEEEVPNNLLQALRLLRVLSFKGYNISELPESIANLKHLRYLDFSDTRIKRLPDSVCNLYNLQTLLLRRCYDLIELPKNMWKLVNLLYLDIEECNRLREMPINIGRLKNLRKLYIFIVGKSRVKELGQLSELEGHLKIGQLQNVFCTTDAAEARLNEKKYLGYLNLEWSENGHDDSQKEYDVLGKLQPHQNLKRLGITSYGGTRFPNWVGSPTYSNMEFVELKNCRYCHFLPTLGRLPSLKRLRIEGLSGIVEVGADFYGNCTTCAFTPFGSLEDLRFSNMCEWEVWRRCDVEKAFPLLRLLYVENCPKLKGDLPFCLPSLTQLRVSKCPALGGSLLPRAPLLEAMTLGCSSMVWNEPLQGLKTLYMWNCKDEASDSLLEKLMLTSTCLETLSFFQCSFLTSLPEMNSTCPLKRLEIYECSSLTSLPEMNSTCPLQSLSISICSSLICLPKNIGLLSSLKSLYIYSCEKLELPMERQFASLEELTIIYNDALQFFPLNLFPNLSKLDLSNCKNLESFSDSEALPPHGLLSQLTQLSISGCPNLSSFSAQGFPFPNLRGLSIGEQQMQALSSPRHHLSVLPSTLTLIQISYDDKLVAFDLISGLHSLTCLAIFGPCKGVKSFPQEGCLPTSLNFLAILNFRDLETLQYMGLHNLTSLSSLSIDSCVKLQCLPQEGLPTSLSSLHIRHCPLLVERLQRDQGEDWDKIASIPNIVIDLEEVLT